MFLNSSVQPEEPLACFLNDNMHTRALRVGVEYNDVYVLQPTDTLWGTNFELRLDKVSMMDSIVDGHRAIVTYFLKDEEHRCTQNLSECLQAAIWQEDAGLVRLLLEAKASPNEVYGHVKSGEWKG